MMEVAIKLGWECSLSLLIISSIQLDGFEIIF